MSSNVLTLITSGSLEVGRQSPVSAGVLVGVAVWICRSEDLTQNEGRCSCSHPVFTGASWSPPWWSHAGTEVPRRFC